jgi:hypothetical protein
MIFSEDRYAVFRIMLLPSLNAHADKQALRSTAEFLR